MAQQIDVTQEIYNILKTTVGKASVPSMQEELNKTNSMAQTILTLCNVFMSQIDTAILQETKFGNLYAKTTKKKNSKYTWVQLMEYGARIIYLIRYMLTNEEIQFLFGITSDKTGETKTAMVSQSQIMNQMTKVGKTAIGIKIAELQGSLQSLNGLMVTENINRKNQWAQIQQLVNVKDYNNSPKKFLDAHRIYQKAHEDQLIYIKFSGAKGNRKSLYYDIDDSGNPDNFIFFNMGWLWEWYNSILLGEDDQKYQIVSQQIDNKSIKGIILESDQIAGTKQGDFIDAQQRQVQAKFNNQKIISYNNIKVIMIQLQEALHNYLYGKQNKQENQNRLIEVLQTHFFPDGALIGNRLANSAVNDLLNKLNSQIGN